MIVCVCKGVSCSRIRTLIAEGVESVEAVGEACGAGTDCGSCRCAIEEMIEEQQELAPLSSLRRGRVSLPMR